MCAFAEMDNQREQLQTDGVLREIIREARICGKNEQKPFLMAAPPHKSPTASIAGHFTGVHPSRALFSHRVHLPLGI
jgi:hypothetical protein